MAGMLQILTYLLAVYLIFKGVEIYQIGLLAASDNPNKRWMMWIGGLALIAAIILAFAFASWQDNQAGSLGRNMPQFPR